ncbi:protein KAKU4 [Gossypium arboreum]|uniref:protein KAKU4 n=1 Tax=Gossypium arboreum TaxID=29729 RepID=UPI0022F19812|nr:protein KAKU4 [Gossypium arboreum]
MATVSGAAPCQDSQSGAEMDLNSTLNNPNWISRHIFPPTRAIVNGASRMLGSVFGFEFSSSSSSSSSECGSCSDDTHDNDDQEVSSQGVHTIEDREPQSFAGKNEPKHLIEQLLMQESFSRQECDKLTDIIKSRVMDSPSTSGLGFGRLNEMPERTGGSDVEIHDFCSTAVLEAKKLLEMKKSEMHHGTSTLNYVTLKHDVEGEEGSPVGMAKSYMRTCPPWATPSKNNIEFRYSSPYSIGGNFLYSSKVLLYAYSYV